MKARSTFTTHMGGHMKLTRFFSICIMVAFAVTALIPTPVYAQPPAPGETFDLVIAANQKPAKLVVQNESGGTLYVNLSGPKNYNFSTSKAGRAEFGNIEPGKYKITLRASTCSDVVSVTKSLTGTVNIKDKVCAKQASKDKDKKQKVGSLTVDNQTGGTLYVTLSGPKTYYFNTSKRGKATFEGIEPGKYTITIRSSACGGSVQLTKNINGKVNLKQFYCR